MPEREQAQRKLLLTVNPYQPIHLRFNKTHHTLRGKLVRRRYRERPPRYEYILTATGRDFRPVIVAMFAWGNRHFAPEGASVLLIDRKSRAKVDPVLVDRRSGKPLDERDYVFAAGPAASERTRRRYEAIHQKQLPKQWAAQKSPRPARGRKRSAS